MRKFFFEKKKPSFTSCAQAVKIIYPNTSIRQWKIKKNRKCPNSNTRGGIIR